MDGSYYILYEVLNLSTVVVVPFHTYIYFRNQEKALNELAVFISSSPISRQPSFPSVMNSNGLAQFADDRQVHFTALDHLLGIYPKNCKLKIWVKFLDVSLYFGGGEIIPISHQGTR